MTSAAAVFRVVVILRHHGMTLAGSVRSSTDMYIYLLPWHGLVGLLIHTHVHIHRHVNGFVHMS